MNPNELLMELLQRQVALQQIDGELVIEAPENALTDRLINEIRIHKSALIKLLNELNKSREISNNVTKRQRGNSYEAPCSLAQQRMLFLEQLAGNQSYYNVPVAFRFSGSLNIEALEFALNSLLKKHDILRTRYTQRNGTYFQCVDPFIASRLPIHELRSFENPLEELPALLRSAVDYAFDLSAEWPIKSSLFRLAENDFVLSINVHHIAVDGWSAKRVIEEIRAGYLQFIHQQVDSDAESQLQYSDFVEWQNHWLSSEGYQSAKTYWLNHLRGAPELHSIPLDFIRPHTQDVNGDSYFSPLQASTVELIEKAAKQYRTTPFIVLQTIYSALIARYSGETDIVFGTAAANRYPIEFVNSIGLFVNTLVLRFSVDDACSFERLLEQAISTNDNANKYQQFPFDTLVEELHPARSSGYNPLVQLMIVMQDDSALELSLPSIDVKPIPQFQHVAKFDIALHIHRQTTGMTLRWEFATSLFKASTIKQLSANFERLLVKALSNPQQALDSIDLVDELPTDALSVLTSQFSSPLCAHQLFESQVEQHPHAIAVRSPDGDITYSELDKKANSLAHFLSNHQGGNVGHIAVCLEKSVDLLIAMMGIWKAGGVYVPIDPHYPSERLQFMVEDAKAPILIERDRSAQKIAVSKEVEVIDIATMLKTENGGCTFDRQIENPAYVIYTSGSTGKPKGVLVSHRALFYSLMANKELMGFNSFDVMPTIGSQAFGVSLLEILLPLISGASVQIIRKSDVSDLQRLVEVTNQVTVLHAVPSLMQQWLDHISTNPSEKIYPHLRLLLVGGESVPDKLLKQIRQWRPSVELIELYGMTESTVVCCSYTPSEDTVANYCIGKPHKNSRFYVLNRSGQRQPIGIPGELHIGGLSIATEYLFQPELTAERFVSLPHRSTERIYKTGDRVRQLEDGNFEFLGRVDHQVSLRGARIELGEIEAIVTNTHGVKRGVASVLTLDNGDRTLILYLTIHGDVESPDALKALIKEKCAAHLPDYMRPSIIEILEQFPLNPNGKVDRKKLPKPNITSEITRPKNDIERRLLSLWESVLPVQDISTNANFFEIGGHSLMATKLLSKIRSEFEVSIAISDVFHHPTIQQCAQLIESSLRAKYATLLTQPSTVANSPDEDEFII